MKDIRSIIRHFSARVLFGVVALTSQANAAGEIPLGVHHSSTDLVAGAQKAYNEGFRHINLWLSPNPGNYPQTTFPAAASLVQRIQSPQFKQVLAMNFETVVLTAYSFASYNWVSSDFQAYNETLALGDRTEFRDLVVYLKNTYPNKKFYIKNWEGDYHLTYTYNLTAAVSQAKLQALRAFFQARSDGFYQGKTLSGATNVSFGIEFVSIARMVANIPSVLGDIVPYVRADFTSYSSWESLGGPDANLGNDIRTGIQRIRTKTNLPLIMGEFGFGNFQTSANRTSIAIQAFKDGGVKEAYYWEMTGADWGLIKPDGSVNPALAILKFENSLRNYPTLQITSINYWGVSQSYVYLEIMGKFPSGTTMDVFCNGSRVPNEITYPSATQTNIRFAKSDDDRPCQVTGKAGSISSNTMNITIPGTAPKILSFVNYWGVSGNMAYLEVYGNFAATGTAPNYLHQFRLVCGGTEYPVYVSYAAANQHNVYFPKMTMTRNCLLRTSSPALSQGYPITVPGA